MRFPISKVLTIYSGLPESSEGKRQSGNAVLFTHVVHFITFL